MEVNPGGVRMYPYSSSSSWPSRKLVAGAWPAQWLMGEEGDLVKEDGRAGDVFCVCRIQPYSITAAATISSAGEASCRLTDGEEEATHGQVRHRAGHVVAHHDARCGG